MSLSQPKIDLAVLYKLHQHAEAGGEAIPPAAVLRLFQIEVPLRRVELALDALEAKQDVERKYDHFYLNERAWEISHDGMMKVDRAIRVPASFIGRLHQNGDHWLETEEAQKAVLKKLPDPQAQIGASTVVLDRVIALPHSRQIDWTKWGTILAAVGIILTVVLWAFSK
jgi:hypothetical protein